MYEKSFKKKVKMVVYITNDELLKLFRCIENTHKISDQHRIEFVSKSGVKLSNVVKKKNSFQMDCKDDE